jgi:hypothetical protein
MECSSFFTPTSKMLLPQVSTSLEPSKMPSVGKDLGVMKNFGRTYVVARRDMVARRYVVARRDVVASAEFKLV